MTHTHWQITSDYGFLSPEPPQSLWDGNLPAFVTTTLKIQQDVTKNQPISDILSGNKLNPNLDKILNVIKTDNQAQNQELFETMFMFFGYLASAWVGMGNQTIPATITLPLLYLAEKVKRPPMLSYAGMVLNNWQLKDEHAGFTPENIDLIFRITDLIDESWFFRVHIAIEAQAGAMLRAMVDVQDAITEEDNQVVLAYLRTMQSGLVQITKTFHKMPELCDPDIYFQKVRPYLMSFGKDIIFEGVTPNPTPLRGGSGAQSSIVPAMLAGLGIAHQESELTASLQDMRPYMPREHRDVIQQMGESKLREYCQQHAPLRDAYNHVLRHLITFRRAHLYYARTYIFEKSTNPIGTGGTHYMAFLSKLIDETAKQML